MEALLKFFHKFGTILRAWVLHRGHNSLEHHEGNHLILICLHLHMHHDCGICHSNGEVVIICAHIKYPFGNNIIKCVSDNALGESEYVIVCESTYGINLLAIQIQMAKFDNNHHILDETIHGLVKYEQVIQHLHHGVASKPTQANKIKIMSSFASTWMNDYSTYLDHVLPSAKVKILPAFREVVTNSSKHSWSHNNERLFLACTFEFTT